MQRAADADADGPIKPTKTTGHRTVRLPSAPAQDLLEYRLAVGRPSDAATGGPGLPSRRPGRHPARSLTSRPYDLRHSFASLLLAEGRQQLYVAKQLGHSLAMLVSTYAHLIEEHEDRDRIDADADADADAEIAAARSQSGTSSVRRSAS